MSSEVLYHIVADVILFIHVLFVVFVIFSLVFIIIGKFLSWAWVRNPWFRLAHFLAISVVVLQSWLGMACPLTDWEKAFRIKAGDSVYSGSFISHWLDTLLFYQAPEWVFTACYTAFGLLVAFSWFWVRPRSFARTQP